MGWFYAGAWHDCPRVGMVGKVSANYTRLQDAELRTALEDALACEPNVGHPDTKPARALCTW